MLDRRTGALLETVNRLCAKDSYQIVEERELLEPLAPAGVDGESVRHMLQHLRECGYLDVTFAEEGVYCVRPLPEGRRYFEERTAERLEAARRRRGWLLLSLCGAFFGAFAGGLLAAVVASFLV